MGGSSFAEAAAVAHTFARTLAGCAPCRCTMQVVADQTWGGEKAALLVCLGCLRLNGDRVVNCTPGLRARGTPGAAM